MSHASVLSACLGHPRIGLARELKRALEAHWAGRSPAETLLGVAAQLRRRHWLAMRNAGIDHIPCNDFSLYDHVLDTAVMVSAVPARFRGIEDPLARYFAMARGAEMPALEMTKWFDTNYHYLVPEIDDAPFALDATKVLGEVAEARAVGVEPRPVVLGPVSFLLLAKPAERGRPLDRLDELLPVYEELLAQLPTEWVQLDEPCLVLDLDDATRAAYRRALDHLTGCLRRPKIMLATYFGPLGDNLALVRGDGLHVDRVHAPDLLEHVLAGLPADAVLSLGLIDGRNVWRGDLDAAHGEVAQAVAALGAARVMVATSCSLLHVPHDLSEERELDPEVRPWLAFAAQKLVELRALALGDDRAFAIAHALLSSRRNSPRTRDPVVRARAAAVTDAMRGRATPFTERAMAQQARFALPLLPTTTIGSFPQTDSVRGTRAAWRSGRITDERYDEVLRAETRRCVEAQESLGLDVLVHGELERTDMVEYFGAQMAGFAFTGHGWVQSYGSRCVKPPILFGDVHRPHPISVEWSRYAQSLTARPVKGMLTGPVTILQWSFVRDDQPRSDTCEQLALALRDEVADLEAAGIGMIQVDEPAIREGLPLRAAPRAEYLRWAVAAFRLATAGVRNDTQVHTHMCYSEFGDILDAIAAMDADVLSIETSRSRMELLGDFGRHRYPGEVGPGVYDIHSPRVPTAEEMLELLGRAAAVIPVERLWVNPDCGLKTRDWPEVEAALARMVAAARAARARFTAPADGASRSRG